MAWDGEFTIDTGDGDGEFIIDDSGNFGVGEDCCCGCLDICGNCKGSQNTPIVSILGSCASDYYNAAGLLSFLDYYDDPTRRYCIWRFWGPVGYEYEYGIWLTFCKVECVFSAAILHLQSAVPSFGYPGGNPCYSQVDMQVIPKGDIECNVGILDGTFTLNGTPSCSGCQATVTL